MVETPSKQQTSFLTDLRRRPKAYLADIKESAALKFAGGNVAYAGFLLIQTGLNWGSGAALLFQSLVTAFTAKKQVDATYKGRAFDAPYKVNGWANVLTAGFIAATAALSFMQEEPQIEQPDNAAIEQTISAADDPANNNDKSLWQSMVFPTITFGFWAAAHFSFGAAANRRKSLKKDGRGDDEIRSDADIGKNVQRGEFVSGVADVTAIFKDKSLVEAGHMLRDPLALHNVNSLVGAPFFLYGFYKSVVRDDDTNGGEKKRLPLPASVRKALHLENQNATPIHYYAGGYNATAVVSAVAAISDPTQWAFAVASAGWGIGYHDMTRETTRPPQSADEYAISIGALPAPEAA